MNPEITTPKSTIKVLLIEDNAESAQLLKMILADEKNPAIDIIWADCMQAGFEALSEASADCILLDLELPDSSGLETVTKIHSQTENIPIVVLTGHDDDAMALEAVRRGAQDYVVKGRVDGKILSRIIRYAIERKRAQEALRESESRYREIASNIPGAVYQFLLKPNGGRSFPFMSDGIFQIMGVRPETVEKDSSKAFSTILPDDIDSVNQSIAESAQTLTTWIKEFRIKAMSGEIKWLRATSSPHLLSDNSILWNGVILDITDLKHIEEELQNANREVRHVLDDLRRTHHELKMAQSQLIQAEKMDSVGRLAAGVAHEVKNPLAIILQGIDHLTTAISENDSQSHAVLRDLEEAVNRADSVIRGLLDFSSLSESVIQPENIQDVIEEALLLVKHELEWLHISVAKKFQNDLPKAKLDRNRMQQVFVNLFLNAIYAMKENGELKITTRACHLNQLGPYIKQRHGDDHLEENDTVIMVEVADTGTGISADILDKIFEPFFTTRRGKGGTGLGLPVVKSIVEMHNGRIQITNQENGGVKASILLKACEEKLP